MAIASGSGQSLGAAEVCLEVHIAGGKREMEQGSL